MTDELPEQAEPPEASGDLESEHGKESDAPSAPPPELAGSLGGSSRESARNRGVIHSAIQRLLGRR